MASFLSYLEPTRPLIDWQKLQQLRWARANQIMADEGLEAIFTNAVENVIYLTGWPRFRTSVHPGSYGVLYFPDDREPIIFCSEGDAGGLLSDRLYEEIHVLPPWQELWPKLIHDIFQSHGLGNSTIGIDSSMSASLYNGIVDFSSDVKFTNARGILNKMKAVKNSEEIKAYEFTVSVVEGGIYSAMNAAKESWGRKTEIEVALEGQLQLLIRGCHSADIWCVSGHRAAPVRRYSTNKVVRGGELAVIDGPGHINGFRSEFARTVWTGGKPSAAEKLLYQTIYQSLEEAKKIMKPGTMTSELEKACLLPVKNAGLEKFYGGYPYTGHGIGIRAEAFNVTSRYPAMDTKLEAGMIFNLEPALWQEGVGGVRIEDTYLITESGFQVLSRVPYEEDLLN